MLALLAMTLMVADHRWTGFDPVRNVLVSVVSPLYTLTHWPFAAARHLAEVYDVRASNEALREQMLGLSIEAQRARALQEDNDRLRALLGATEPLSETALLAAVIGLGTDPQRRSLIIDRGDVDGVTPGQPAIDAHGLMGQIVDVGRNASRLLLISDASHVTPVVVVRNDYRAILYGTGTSRRLELRHVPETADVDMGDLLVTSGLDQRFPAGYPVATIVAVRQVPGEPFLEILAEPAARLERSRRLALLSAPAPRRLPEAL